MLPQNRESIWFMACPYGKALSCTSMCVVELVQGLLLQVNKIRIIPTRFWHKFMLLLCLVCVQSP